MPFTIELPTEPAQPQPPPGRFTIEPPQAPADAAPKFTIEHPDGSIISNYVRGVGQEVAGAVGQSWDDLKRDFERTQLQGQKPPKGWWDQVKQQFDSTVALGKLPVDAFNLVTSPISGLIRGAVGKPVEKATGGRLPAEAWDQALMAIRAPGGLEAASAAREAARLGKNAPPAGPGPAAAPGQPPSAQPAPASQPAPGAPSTGATPTPAPAVAPEGPLSRPTELGKPRQVEDQLFQLRNLETADKLDALGAVQKLPEDYTPELDEKLYHHEENPTGVPLAAREQAIYDEHVKPIREEANALSKDLSRLTGVTPDLNDIYTPRYVAGRTRSYGEAIAQWMKGVETRFGGASARTMRKTVDAQKGRDFFIAEHGDTGERNLVYVAPDRSVYSFDGTPQIKTFGRLVDTKGPREGSIVHQTMHGFPGNDVHQWRLTQATTKEIEAQAQTRYVKSVMANRLDNLAKLRSAVRNAKYIEDLKALPQFADHFKLADQTPVLPRDANGREWRRINLPQLQQYVASPKIVDALDDFMRTSKDAEGMNRALQAIGRAMNAVMFINPKAHIDNVFNHMLVGRGLVGNIAHAPSVVRSLVRGAREVWNLGPEYRQALRAGLSLPYSRIVAADLHPALLKRLGAQAGAHPGPWNRIAGQMGYPSAKIMLKRWAQVPNRVLWASQDVMMMSRVLELKERGIPIEKAIRTSESEIPNYRVPGQVLGSRGLAELFGNPAFGRFGRYQFGRLRAYTDMVKEAFARTGGLASPERLHAFDQIIMLGVYTFGVYSLYDWMWQQITGNPLAYTVRSGASSIPRAIQDVYEGRKKAGDLIYSLFTIGVPIELASEAYQGRYGWSGQPIVRDADVRNMSDPVRARQVGRDIASYFAQMFSSIGTLVSPSSTETAGQTGLRAAGVISPTPEQMQRREKAKAYDERTAKRRAYKQDASP